MNTIKADVEITAEGGLKLLSPLPPWLKPGRAKVLLTVASAADSGPRPRRPKLFATPAMLEQRKAAYAALRAIGGLRQVIPDPTAWQRLIREDVALPGRD